ncbi:hypothetical protein [Marinicella gelatinilytica]|uniref:hypothetical protein n=1 Tax=Marinicella gelatinilytica TaxID=2996017 RepID=UPI002260AAB5|nr:hypothetical protein [Marinicella gelatinilytica]MCX7544404.1 hypothetical protein [Marinicella gelatinilytica]
MTDYNRIILFFFLIIFSSCVLSKQKKTSQSFKESRVIEFVNSKNSITREDFYTILFDKINNELIFVTYEKGDKYIKVNNIFRKAKVRKVYLPKLNKNSKLKKHSPEFYEFYMKKDCQSYSMVKGDYFCYLVYLVDKKGLVNFRPLIRDLSKSNFDEVNKKFNQNGFVVKFEQKRNRKYHLIDVIEITDYRKLISKFKNSFLNLNQSNTDELESIPEYLISNFTIEELNNLNRVKELNVAREILQKVNADNLIAVVESKIEVANFLNNNNNLENLTISQLEKMHQGELKNNIKLAIKNKLIEKYNTFNTFDYLIKKYDLTLNFDDLLRAFKVSNNTAQQYMISERFYNNHLKHKMEEKIDFSNDFHNILKNYLENTNGSHDELSDSTVNDLNKSIIAKQNDIINKTIDALKTKSLIGAKYISGIIWQDQPINAQDVTKSEAENICNNLELLGSTDWKLPNLDEYALLPEKSSNLFSYIARFDNSSSDYVASGYCGNRSFGILGMRDCNFCIDSDYPKEDDFRRCRNVFKLAFRCILDVQSYAVKQIELSKSFIKEGTFKGYLSAFNATGNKEHLKEAYELANTSQEKSEIEISIIKNFGIDSVFSITGELNSKESDVRNDVSEKLLKFITSSDKSEVSLIIKPRQKPKIQPKYGDYKITAKFDIALTYQVTAFMVSQPETKHIGKTFEVILNSSNNYISKQKFDLGFITNKTQGAILGISSSRKLTKINTKISFENIELIDK